jgi:hypothetical protein
MDVIKMLDAYTEVSPTGTGVHMLVTGTKPAGPTAQGIQGGELAVYSGGRYFTVTGMLVDGAPKDIPNRTSQLAQVYAKYMQEDEERVHTVEWDDSRSAETVKAEASAILSKMVTGRGADKRVQLMLGNASAYDSQSEADLALCNYLARYTDSDPKVMDAAFRITKLMRPKWDEVHGSDGKTYGEITITKAIGDQQRSGKASKDFKSSADLLEILRGMGYSFRTNIMNDRPEFRPGEFLCDGMEAVIKTQLRDMRLTLPEVSAALTAAHADAYQHPFHPIKDYLEELEWDGEDHIKALSGYFTDSQGEFQKFLHLWLLGAVAKIYESGQNVMLVLESPQDIGKSYFVRWLCPLQTYFIEEAVRPDSKDDQMMRISKWVWEVSELGSTTRRQDRESLKAVITQIETTLRVPYAKYPITKPNTASYIGTLNDEGTGFLGDPTGNRRFMVVTVTDIDWAYAKEVDAEQVWAQAVAAYKAGESWRPDEEVVQLIKEKGEEYEVTNPLEDLIQDNFIITLDLDDFMTTIEIKRTLNDAGWGRGLTDRVQAMDIAKTLKSMGTTKIKQKLMPDGSKKAGYRGIKLDAMNEAVKTVREEAEDPTITVNL